MINFQITLQNGDGQIGYATGELPPFAVTYDAASISAHYLAPTFAAARQAMEAAVPQTPFPAATGLGSLLDDIQRFECEPSGMCPNQHGEYDELDEVRKRLGEHLQ